MTIIDTNHAKVVQIFPVGVSSVQTIKGKIRDCKKRRSESVILAARQTAEKNNARAKTVLE